MKLHFRFGLITSLILGIFLSNSFVMANEFKGFIALDLLNIVKTEGEAQDSITGIGAFDLKFYARHDKISMKVKLDLDDSNIGDQYNIFEEALASYFHTENLRISGGKGKVPFHRMRYGVLSSHFVDGGSLIGTNHSFRDQDNNLMISIRRGSFNEGYFHYLTFFAKSRVPVTDELGNVIVEDYGIIKTENQNNFNAKNQRGFATKYEYYFNSNDQISASFLYYYNDYRPKETYAFDFGGEIRADKIIYWWEYVYAKVSTHPYDAYSTKDQDEHLASYGLEKVINDKYNFLFNLEYAFVDSQRHTQQFSNSSSVLTPSRNDGNDYETTTFKIGSGLKYKLSRSAFVVFGLEFEQREETQFDGANRSIIITDTLHAYQTGLDFAFWF